MSASTTIIIPPVNATGKFLFKEPYADKPELQNIELTVVAIRTLGELADSNSYLNEHPYDNIYAPVDLSMDDFEADVKAKIPIIIFANTSGEYLFVPANRVASMPIVSGIKYQEKVLAIPLGNLPLDTNFDALKTNVKEIIDGMIGIDSNPEILDTSSIVYVSEEKDYEYKELRQGRIKVHKTFETRYLEALERATELEKQLKDLNHFLLRIANSSQSVP